MATMLPNIMDMFRGAPAVSPQQTGVPNNPNQPNTPPNGVVPDPDPQALPQTPQLGPDGKPIVADPTKKPSPLDSFSKLWDAPTKEELERQTQNTGVDFDNIDAAKMMEAARKVDFSQILSPEMQANIAKGGEEGVKATIEAMNSVAQLTYGQSAMAASKMIGAAVKQAETRFAAQIPGLVKAAAIDSSLAKSNPIFQNPAIKPIVDGLKNQLLQKFPDHTDAQLTEMAQTYFLSVSQSFAAPNTPNSSTTKPKPKPMTGKGDDDWDEFFSNP